MNPPTALIADDEPLLRDALHGLLRLLWPELKIVALVRNGREAIAQFEALSPQICFLDVHMPGISGIEAARQIGRRAHLVFVTAYDHYAVQAFAHGVLDYLVKPVEPSRLAETVARLKERLAQAREMPLDTDSLLRQLAQRLALAGAPAMPAPVSAEPRVPTHLQWLRASIGPILRLISVDDIDYLRSDAKYTRIAWRDDDGQLAEALIRTPLKELVEQLDPAQFAQVHRAVVVRLRAISHVSRGDSDSADIHLKGRREVLPVSRSFMHLFKQM